MIKNTTLKVSSISCKWLFRATFMLFFLGIFQQAHSQKDLGLASLVAPSSPKCAASNQTVTVRIKNYLVDTIKYNVDTVFVTVKVTGASIQTFKDTLTSGFLAFDSTQDVTVTIHCNLSVAGIHTFKAYTTLNGDLIALNDTLMASIIVNPIPTAHIMAQDTTTFCQGGHVILASSSSTGNVWTGGTTNDSLTVSASGPYSVTVTINGCSTTSDTTIVVTVEPLPTVTLSSFTTTPCPNAPAFALTGGSPAGGMYSGIGVSAGLFHPNQAGHIQGITYTITDTNGCSNSATKNITVSACTGVEENFASQEVKVFPNPSQNGLINIAVKNANFNELLISMVDILGKEVFKTTDKNIQQQMDYNKSINIANLPKGIYFIKLSAGADFGQVVQIRKLIVE